MAALRLWAPKAARVDLLVGGQSSPMSPEGGGWFSVEAPAGDYLFSLDGGPGRPDPRSGWQPEGVDGPSRVVDHRSFPWTDGAWHGAPLASAVLYELHVGTFTPTGTFEAIVEKLPHLVDLGVTAVELMPVAEFAGSRGWGYDGVDLYAPHHANGGPEGLKRLVDACHSHGLAVVMDVVYNHLGPAGNYLDEFGPYFTDRYRTPWGWAVNLDGPGSDQVRAFFIDNAVMWLRDYHCDGLRLDAVHAIVDTSATHLLEELSTRVEELEAGLGRDLWLIAESDLNDPRVVSRREVGGYGIDAQWSDDYHHALHSVLTGERSGYYADFDGLSDLATALRQGFVYVGQHSGHRGRRHGRAPAGLSGHRFLGYLQNHDQVGNRAQGERSAALMSPSRVKVAAALVLSAPFVPMLFQGEEWGAGTPFQYFTDHEPELGRLVSEGRRNEFEAFGWKPDEVPDPQDPATFERSQLDWSEPAQSPHSEILEWHRQLLSLRRTMPELTNGRLDRVRLRCNEEAGWLVMTRGRVTVAFNLADSPARFTWPPFGAQVLLNSGDFQRDGDHIQLGPDAVVVALDEGSDTANPLV